MSWAGLPIVVKRKRIRLRTMRLQVRSLALLSGLGIWHCHELWWRSQMRLQTCVAVAGGTGQQSQLSLDP